jgi:hypothetical protein
MFVERRTTVGVTFVGRFMEMIVCVIGVEILLGEWGQ